MEHLFGYETDIQEMDGCDGTCRGGCQGCEGGCGGNNDGPGCVVV